MSDQTGVTLTAAAYIKVNDHLVIHDRPCKVVDKRKSKTGKHGGCKIHFAGVDIFTGNRHEIIYKVGDNVSIPIITKTYYQLIDITSEKQPDGSIISFCVLEHDGKLREDLMLPATPWGELVRLGFNNGDEVKVMVMSALGTEQIII